MSNIQIPPDSSGKHVDTVTLSDAGVEVHRQKLVMAGGSGTAEVVAVINAAPAGTEYAVATRQVGTANVALASPVAISGTPSVVLAAGTANFGSLNNISRTVQVAVGTPFTLNNISATVTVAGNVNISATANVAGTLNISGSVQVSGAVGLFYSADVQSASRGPRCIIASTSANVTLIAAPGANLSVFITSLAVTNASGTNSRARIGTSATIGNVTMMLAQSGGGFVMNFAPPWQISVNEAVLCSVKPNVSEGIFNVHFFVASADLI